MHLFPNTELLIETEQLLSSTTYPTDNNRRCAYCHEEVIPYLVDYKRLTLQVYRCACSRAVEEAQLKEQLVHQLEQLQSMKNHMDLGLIGTAVYNYEVKRLRLKCRPKTP